jgi:carbon starvation protein
MSLALLALAVLAALAAGYVTYGRFVARRLALDPSAKTPAVAREDGVDFVPTKRGYLLGQHFSAIAAAGPIVGPILACQQFGWLPCVLWIGLGVVFVGAVHDLVALVASVRHGAASIVEIVRRNVSKRAWAALLAFIWVSLVYVIVAFTDVTAGTFLGTIEELEGTKVSFDSGGAVAFASTAYLLLAVLMGLVVRRWKPRLSVLTFVFVPATLVLVWLGTKCSTILAWHGDPDVGRKTWGAILLAYCFVASVVPVWALLQPRGYLGGFVLYVVLAVGVVGILFGGFSVEQPAFKGFTAPDPKTGLVPTAGYLFPFLFVTIACGACSGFHGLVCSGTTSKQVANEEDCRPVGYGAMLLEGFVAVVALATVVMVAKPAGAPGAIYGQGVGRFLASIVGERHLLFAVVFGSMAFSTFVFDTLDVCTRLGRYILQELFGRSGRVAAFVATLSTVGLPLVFVLSARKGAYLAYWTLFGTSNQLLAALTLLGIAVWLRRLGKAAWFVLLPMAFVATITVWALVAQARPAFDGAADSTARVNGAVACGLLALAAVFAVECVRALRATAREGVPAPDPT